MKILVFKDGSTRQITGELGKYWLTGEDRVRKLSRSIAEVREIPEAEQADAPAETAAEPEKKPAAKKKTAKKKKEAPHQSAAATASPKGSRKDGGTEVTEDGERGE